LPGALLAIAAAALVCAATRLGEDANRRQEAEAVFFRLEARANEQNALEWEAIQAAAPPDAELGRRVDATRREIDGSLPSWRSCCRATRPPTGWLLAVARARLADEVQALRRITATLRPPILEERGLVSALREYLRLVEEQAGVQCARAGGLRERLPTDQEVVLYRVAQEALSNVAKHAHAGSVRVELFEDADVVVLVVDDDGVGFDPGLQPQGNLDHFGMAGMRERLELAGGTWDVRSRAGAGTTLVATLPRELVPA
jgi:two-component sensor histidine kinase